MVTSAVFDAPFIAMAHRGGPLLPANQGRENTLSAFLNAWQLGFTHLETDVHLTRDGHLVAFHDEDLGRLTGRPGGVAHHTLAELGELTVGGEPVPTLAELLDALPGARFNIDLKAPGTEELLPTVLDWHRASTRVCVASFDQRRLRRFRRLSRGRVATSCGPWETMALLAGQRLPSPWGPVGVAFQVPTHHRVAGRLVPVVTPRFVRRAHASGRQVHVWTIDDPEQMHTLIDQGVDGLISDAIHVLRAVLQERGLWAHEQPGS